MIDPYFLALWACSILAKSATAAVMTLRRLAPRYPVLCCYLVLTAIQSSFRLIAMQSGEPAYRAAWLQSEAFSIGLTTALVIEAYWRMMLLFPGKRTFAVILGAFVSMLAYAAVAQAARWGVVAWWPLEVSRLTAMRRQWILWALLFLLAVRGYCWLARGYVTMCRNMSAHVSILAWLLGSQVVASSLSAANAQWSPWVAISQVMRPVATLACCIAWMWNMRAERKRDGAG